MATRKRASLLESASSKPSHRAARRHSDRVPASAALELQGTGTLCIIGGREDKKGDREILRAVVTRAGRGRIVVATVASRIPEELWAIYS